MGGLIQSLIQVMLFKPVSVNQQADNNIPRIVEGGAHMPQSKIDISTKRSLGLF